MYRLRVLGGFALESAPGDSVGPLPQRRAEAVLAFLAVAGDRGCRRDRLIALLWPDSDDARGRHSLRDALHAIRQVLGADAISSAGEDLRLSSDVESDVQSFERALAASQFTAAVALYRGPLLDGFHLDRAAEFERWIDSERGDLCRQCAEAMERLAEEAEHAERWREAAQWWGRSEALDPFSTPVVLCRMRALARAGDRANALKVAEAHRLRLVRELEVEPDSGFFEEVARLRGSDVGQAPSAPFAGGRAPGATAERSLDRVFLALKDPARRAVVEQLSLRPASLCTLERLLAVPQPAVQQYVQDLESSGLVSPRQEGATRRYRINLSWLRAAERWIAGATNGKRKTDG
jgi:DNA-binding SARP family transcriptional activator/DNA-binding transcriptional ArsR family regulator